MIFRVTEILNYKRCRRMWDFSSESRQGLAKLVPSAAFNLGTAVHRGLEGWLRGEEPVAAYSKECADTQDKINTIWHRRTGTDIPDSKLAPLLDTVILGAAMMQNYVKRWGAPLPDNYISIKPEQRVMVPIPNTDHFLSGKMDGILGDAHGRLFVLDHKTYNARPKKDVIEKAEQFIAYVWMLTKLAPEFNMEVAGLAYDGLWKRAEPPSKVDNRIGTLEDLFLRFLTIPSEEEIEEYENELTVVATEMGSNPYITHHRTTTGSCEWGCSHNELCYATSRGEDTQHILDTDYTVGDKELLTLLQDQYGE